MCTHGRKTAARRYAGLAGCGTRSPQPAPVERRPGRARGDYWASTQSRVKADETPRPWRVSGGALGRFHRSSLEDLGPARTRQPWRSQSRLLFQRRHKMASPGAGLERAGVRSGQGRGRRGVRGRSPGNSSAAAGCC